MKVLLISGHGAGDFGATSKFGREAEQTIYMVKEIKKTLDQYATVTVYPTSRNAVKDLKKGKVAVNFGKYDYVLEVHFNAARSDSAGNGKAKGTEIYVTTSEKGVGVEKEILKAISKFGLPNRGVKRKNFNVISRAKRAGVSAALLEVCFIDDKDDMDIYREKKAKIARAVAIAVAKGFGLKKQGGKEEKIQVGSKVKIKSGATYGGEARGKKVPKEQIGVVRTVDKIQKNKGEKEARLEEIHSWVPIKNLELEKKSF